MAGIVNYDNPANYRKTSKKDYAIYARLIPEGLVVRDKALGREYMSNRQDRVAFSGTAQEMWLSNVQNLVNNYVTLESQRINDVFLKRMERDWVKVKPMRDAGMYYACHIPINQKPVIPTMFGNIQANRVGSGLSHGKGDFVVCPAMPNGMPNLQQRFLVHGKVFATTYDVRAFRDCVLSSVVNRSLPSPGIIVGLSTAVNKVQKTENAVDTFRSCTKKYIQGINHYLAERGSTLKIVMQAKKPCVNLNNNAATEVQFDFNQGGYVIFQIVDVATYNIYVNLTGYNGVVFNLPIREQYASKQAIALWCRKIVNRIMQ